MTVSFEKNLKVYIRVETPNVTGQATQPRDLPTRPPRILIIGCGGTGGWVVPQVARQIKSLGVGSLALADGDTVEPKNLGRQNFVERDLGENKAVALAKRYSGSFGIPIRAIPGFLEDVQGLRRRRPNIILGCVDSHTARRMIAEYFEEAYQSAWIDAGNESVGGQVVCGYRSHPYRPGSTRGNGPIEVALPTISQMVDLPLAAEKRLSCAELVEVADQVSSVNAMAATYAANFCRMILEDVKRSMMRQPVKGLSHHAVFFNVETGGTSARYNSPDNLAVAKKPIAPWRGR